MSALAILLKNKGFFVQGSNNEKNEETEMLISHEIPVFYSHHASNVQNADVVVYNSAIKESNPELSRAREMGLTVLTRAQLLGAVAKDYDTVIAVSGSHGKTTTTSLIGHILNMAGKHPTVHVGGVMINYHSNFLLGEKQIFVTEACEYKNNFHSLFPTTLVVLNIEADHLDFFQNYAAVEKSFQVMIDQSKSLVIYASTNLTAPPSTTYFCMENYICNESELKTLKHPTIWARNICYDCDGKYSYDCYQDTTLLGKIELGFPCEHNVKNSLAAIATCLKHGVAFQDIQTALKSFLGVKRRFETMGNIGKAKAIHDYAHHPTEIKSTIDSARKFCKGKIWVVFEPHTYTRTKALMPEFLEALAEGDEIMILPTYSAREEYLEGGDASDLARELKKLIPTIYAPQNWLEAQRTLKELAQKDDLILLLGAGSISHFYENYLNTFYPARKK